MVSKFIIGQMLFGITLSAVTWGLSRFVSPRRSFRDDRQIMGTIAPSQPLTFVITAIGFSASLYFINDYRLGGLVTRGVYDPSWMIGLWLGGFLLAFTTICATTFSTAFDVSWTPTTVSGPISYKVPPFGPEKATLRFDEITQVGMDALGSWYITNAEGIRIRWSCAYSGYRNLMRAIEAARPDLFKQEEHDPC